MFEKEAEGYASQGGLSKEKHFFGVKAIAFKDGAEYGYNKANEWHYMKDVNCYEDLHFPPEEEEKGRVLIWKVQVITENGVKLPVCYHCGSYGDLWYEINAYHVIAWKEVVLPDSYKVVKLWDANIALLTGKIVPRK
jgi:hypothetical protein